MIAQRLRQRSGVPLYALDQSYNAIGLLGCCSTAELETLLDALKRGEVLADGTTRLDDDTARAVGLVFERARRRRALGVGVSSRWVARSRRHVSGARCRRDADGCSCLDAALDLGVEELARPRVGAVARRWHVRLRRKRATRALRWRRARERSALAVPAAVPVVGRVVEVVEVVGEPASEAMGGVRAAAPVSAPRRRAFVPRLVEVEAAL